MSKIANNNQNRYKSLLLIKYVALKADRKIFTLDKYIKFNNNAEKLLSRIIISAVIVLAAVISVQVFFLDIGITWKIAITIFILILPVCLFLQAYLNVQTVKEERCSKLQEGFRKTYARYLMNENPKVVRKEDVEKDDDFRNLIRQRSLLIIDDGQLYSIYRQAYQLYLSYKNKRIKIKGNPEEDELKDWLLRFELDELLNMIVSKEMKEDGTDFPSYLLPLSFFLFIYFSGFLMMTTFIDSIFNPVTSKNDDYIPLFENKQNSFTNQQIPIVVIQWGFLGGLVYTSISLLNRFLRNDLVPRVYFNSAFRLILSAVVAIVIYFVYMITNPTGNPDTLTPPPQVLLLCFLAGVAPIQFLIHFADTQLSKINEGWKRRSTPGDRPITQIEGIDSVTSQRLSEEGINYVQEMALCNYLELSSKTKFPLEIVYNWKDQAILYTLTGSIGIDSTDALITENKSNGKGKKFLSDVLEDKLGIGTISSLIDLWTNINSPGQKVENEQKTFLCDLFNIKDGETNKIIRTQYLLENIVKQGKIMLNNSISRHNLDSPTIQLEGPELDLNIINHNRSRSHRPPYQYHSTGISIEYIK